MKNISCNNGMQMRSHTEAVAINSEKGGNDGKCKEEQQEKKDAVFYIDWRTASGIESYSHAN